MPEGTSELHEQVAQSPTHVIPQGYNIDHPSVHTCGYFEVLL